MTRDEHQQSVLAELRKQIEIARGRTRTTVARVRGPLCARPDKQFEVRSQRLATATVGGSPCRESEFHHALLGSRRRGCFARFVQPTRHLALVPLDLSSELVFDWA